MANRVKLELGENDFEWRNNLKYDVKECINKMNTCKSIELWSS